MVDADLTFSLLFVAIGLLAHIGSRRFTPFRRRVPITGGPSYVEIDLENLEARTIVRFRILQALKWMALGMALAIVIF
jgi:hypothetical protein